MQIKTPNFLQSKMAEEKEMKFLAKSRLGRQKNVLFPRKKKKIKKIAKL